MLKLKKKGANKIFEYDIIVNNFIDSSKPLMTHGLINQLNLKMLLTRQ